MFSQDPCALPSVSSGIQKRAFAVREVAGRYVEWGSGESDARVATGPSWLLGVGG